MYICSIVICILLFLYGIYKKNPVVPLSEGRKPFNWLTVMIMIFTCNVAAMFILNPSIELQTVMNDPVLNIFEYKTNGLMLVWFLSQMIFFISFFVLVLFKEIISKPFIIFTDIVSIIAICGSYSGILKYLNNLNYSLYSVIGIALFILGISVFLSRKEKYLKYTSYFNYFAIVALTIFLMTLNKISYSEAISEFFTDKTLTAISNAHESNYMNEYCGWIFGWFWLSSRFIKWVCEGHRIINSVIVAWVTFFIMSYIWFVVNEGADTTSLSNTTKNIILFVAITTFLTSFNALVRNIYSTSKKNFIFCIALMIGILTLTYLGYINVFLCGFYGFIASLIYWCGYKLIFKEKKHTSRLDVLEKYL